MISPWISKLDYYVHTIMPMFQPYIRVFILISWGQKFGARLSNRRRFFRFTAGDLGGSNGGDLGGSNGDSAKTSGGGGHKPLNRTTRAQIQVFKVANPCVIEKQHKNSRCAAKRISAYPPQAARRSMIDAQSLLSFC